jgi:N-acetyl-anhydromuramyl-L-alanine amidase AmpD
MKKVITLAFVFLANLIWAIHTDPIVVNPYETYFTKAYSLYPEIPKGTLEAVAFTNTHFNHITHSAEEAESCSGIPKAYGVMGLTLDGKNYFKENLKKVATLSGYSIDDIINSPEKNILAYAKAFSVILARNVKYKWAEANISAVLNSLTELPYATAGQNFAEHSQIYGMLSFMNDSKMQKLYKFPAYNFDLVHLFGEEDYKVLSSSHVFLSRDKVTDNKGNAYRGGNFSVQSADYGPALWVASPNYNSRGGTAITAVTIHDMEGSYASAISWFQNTSSQVSAHYCMRSSDGQITQMVLEINRAWHVGTENNYTIGIEHEGYASQTGWYTTAMYTQSALLVQNICTDNSINPKRTLFQPWGSTTYYSSSSIPGSCTKIKGHQHYPNQTHTDPGPNWDWDYYYKLVNDPAPAPTVYTATTGSFYDSGGSAGNYSDDERLLWKIAPPGATNVTLTFNSYDTENTWDYMYVYDGADIWAPLIGHYTGTTLPGTLIASSGTMTIEFRSDCATTATGWNASWTSNVSSTLPSNLAVTSASCPSDSVRLHWTNSGANWFLDVTDDPTWTSFYNKAVPNLTSMACPGGFANNLNTSVYLAFQPNTTYYWRVYDGTTQVYGNSFMTPSCNYNDTTCSGTFYDTGGNLANYSGNEDYISIIQPNGATSVSMTFSSFDTEAGFDSLWVYDGGSTSGTLLGVYTGTVSPGTLVANSGAMALRFKADPFVNHAGWAATWSCIQNTTGVSSQSAVKSLQLSAYPNPFTEAISVNYSLSENSSVKISLVDVIGREIILQNENNQIAGEHKIQLDTKSLSLTKGVYFLKLENKNKTAFVKLVKS